MCIPNGILAGAGFGIKENSDLEVAVFVTTSSAGERGVLAKGELLVGRVLGLPSPRVKRGGVEASGVATGVICALGPTSGEPGGVVLSSPAAFAGVAITEDTEAACEELG